MINYTRNILKIRSIGNFICNWGKNCKVYCSKKTYIEVLVIVVTTIAILSKNSIVMGGINASDLNGNLGGFGYMINVIKTEGHIPMWNPYIGHGIPTIADPLNIFFSPFIFPLYLLFDYVTATQLFFFEITIFCVLSMFYFVKSLSRDNVFSLILSLTYTFSGYIGAQFVSGHIEKVIAYALLPILVWTLIKIIINAKLRYVLPHSAVLLTLFLSGGIYEMFYYYLGILGLSIVFVVIAIVKWRIDLYIKSFMLIGTSALIWMCLGAFKLLPFIEGLNQIQRDIDPYQGSLKVQDMLYSLFAFPSGSWFEKINSISPMPWWEQTAYIGAGTLILFSVCSIATILRKPSSTKSPSSTIGVVLITLLIVNILYLGISTVPFNPVKILFNTFPKLHNFAIPSRSLSYTIIYICAILAFIWPSVTSWKLVKKALLVTMLVNFVGVVYAFSIITSAQQGLKSFSKVMPLSVRIQEILASDKSNFFIAQHPFYDLQPSLFDLVTNKIRILNPNYGFGLKGSSLIDFSRAEFMLASYLGPYPKYIIYPRSTMPISLKNLQIISRGNFILYRSAEYTPLAYNTNTLRSDYPKVDVESKDIQININQEDYTITSNNTENFKYLNVLISNHPGWRAFRDGRPTPILSGNFISVNQLRGFHKYTFKFHSVSATVGLTIGLVSWGILILVFNIKRIKDLLPSRYSHKNKL